MNVSQSSASSRNQGFGQGQGQGIENIRGIRAVESIAMPMTDGRLTLEAGRFTAGIDGRITVESEAPNHIPLPPTQTTRIVIQDDPASHSSKITIT